MPDPTPTPYPPSLGEPMNAHCVATIADHVRRAGHRFNAERGAIVQALLEADAAVTADEAWFNARRSHARVSRATVYRTLNILTRLGITESSIRPRGGQSFRLKRARASIYLMRSDLGVIDEIDDPSLSEILEAHARRRGYRLCGAVELRVEPMEPVGRQAEA